MRPPVIGCVNGGKKKDKKLQGILNPLPLPKNNKFKTPSLRARCSLGYNLHPGYGKTTFLRYLNRMNDTMEGCRITGDIRLDG
ncbi:hypothetical protein [Nitrosococcus wardiae]|uniref:hypothetical protein n=1 Tax=Nitrosococcus wardiae TaxID=1814290 RepID=UPI003B83969C